MTTATPDHTSPPPPPVLGYEEREVEVVAHFVLDGEPVSKGRPRFSKQGEKVRTYTPEKTSSAENSVAWGFRRAAPAHRPDKETTYGLLAVFVVGTRHRRDVDNMLKLVMDGLNKVAWADDDQVVEVSGRKVYDPEGAARSEIVIYRVGEIPGPPPRRRSRK